LKKGIEHKFFFRLKEGHQKDEIEKQIIKLAYFDETNKKQ
jgi:hypothetical protein